MNLARPVTLPLADAVNMFAVARQAGCTPTVADWGSPEDRLRWAREEIEQEGRLSGAPESVVIQAARRLVDEDTRLLRSFEQRAAKSRRLRLWRGRPFRFTSLQAVLIDSLRVLVQRGLEPDATGVAKKRTAFAAWKAVAKLLDLDPWAALPSYKRAWPDACAKAERAAAFQVRKAQEQHRSLRRKWKQSPGMSGETARGLEREALLAAGDFWAGFRIFRAAATEGKCIPSRAFDRPDEYPGFAGMISCFILALQKLSAYAQLLDDIDVLDRTLGSDAHAAPAV
ncbi:MAG: hypothetical protein ACRC67_27280 [Inquilinus sp.]|uniref:hypothetical protein n=1 Tax=Inquilinus sp. TaxID=1932117 RepID=UPI003F36F8F8